MLLLVGGMGVGTAYIWDITIQFVAVNLIHLEFQPSKFSYKTFLEDFVFVQLCDLNPEMNL